MESKREIKNGMPRKAALMLKCLLISYIVTGAALLMLALLLYKLQLSEDIVNVGVLIIYVLAAFTSGFLAGKCMCEKRFLWGLGAGFLYFIILVILTLMIRHTFGDFGNQFFTTLMICAGSGMLGGMVS